MRNNHPDYMTNLAKQAFLQLPFKTLERLWKERQQYEFMALLSNYEVSTKPDKDGNFHLTAKLDFDRIPIDLPATPKSIYPKKATWVTSMAGKELQQYVDHGRADVTDDDGKFTFHYYFTIKHNGDSPLGFKEKLSQMSATAREALVPQGLAV